VPGARQGRSRSKPHWTRLDDDALLDLRFCDLDLRIADSPVAPHVERLYGELAARGITVHPHCWFSSEWFSPDGIPGIAVPFYLAHPRLVRLERRFMREVEGGNTRWLMRILRHEAGHAVDTAYRLRHRADWRRMFGNNGKPYPKAYKPRPGSRRFVQHLGHWYAQSHPTEDFAETFAVWLAPRSTWRRDYAGWPALRKLEYVERVMAEVAGTSRRVHSRAFVEPLSLERKTLREHYAHMQSLQRLGHATRADRVLERAFTRDPDARGSAAALLRDFGTRTRQAVAREAGCSAYNVHQVVRAAIRRCEVLELRLRYPKREARRRARRLLVRLARITAHAKGRRVIM
jgi:Putative zinc-binding metallo-peptidase